MYAYFKGSLEYIAEDSVIIEVAGIGYHIFLSHASLAYLPSIGDEVKIYTYTCVREDAFLLYGFMTTSDLNIFKQCITVSGVGPKVAMGILSVMDADALRFAIIAGDSKAISKAPGIGAKTAQRLILELKDRVSVEDTIKCDEKRLLLAGGVDTDTTTLHQDAVDALVALGYGSSESLRAVKSVEQGVGMDVEQLLKAALRYLF
ncbi:MAG: Holliday junction branch migration protein RuvA [Lachnospiraceae bacterium]